MRNEVELVKSMFSQIPPDYGNIKDLLRRAAFSSEELAAIAYSVAEDCFCEYRDALNDTGERVTLDALHSNYLLQSLRLLLDAGLDPNVCSGDDNVLWDVQWVDTPGVAASAMRLLLENGGNPNHIDPNEPETLFEYIAFEVSYDRYTHDYFHTVQCWLVLMAYGGCRGNGEIPLTMLGSHTVQEFKHFEKFDYSIEPLPQEPDKYGCWIMHIFDIESGEEVARYE